MTYAKVIDPSLYLYLEDTHLNLVVVSPDSLYLRAFININKINASN